MIALLAALFGLCIGSFLNVVIYRLPRGESVVSPGSRCGACGRPVRWYDNVPVVSYLALGGKCRDCRASFSPRYLFVELLTAIVFAITAAATPPDLALLVRLIFAALLIPLFFIDLALPRDIEPAVAALENVFLYNLDDLAKIAAENLAARQAEIAKCRALLGTRAETLWQHVEPKLSGAAPGAPGSGYEPGRQPSP